MEKSINEKIIEAYEDVNECYLSNIEKLVEKYKNEIDFSDNTIIDEIFYSENEDLFAVIYNKETFDLISKSTQNLILEKIIINELPAFLKFLISEGFVFDQTTIRNNFDSLSEFNNFDTVTKILDFIDINKKDFIMFSNYLFFDDNLESFKLFLEYVLKRKPILILELKNSILNDFHVDENSKFVKCYNESCKSAKLIHFN